MDPKSLLESELELERKLKAKEIYQKRINSREKSTIKRKRNYFKAGDASKTRKSCKACRRSKTVKRYMKFDRDCWSSKASDKAKATKKCGKSASAREKSNNSTNKVDVKKTETLNKKSTKMDLPRNRGMSNSAKASQKLDSEKRSSTARKKDFEKKNVAEETQESTMTNSLKENVTKATINRIKKGCTKTDEVVKPTTTNSKNKSKSSKKSKCAVKTKVHLKNSFKTRKGE